MRSWPLTRAVLVPVLLAYLLLVLLLHAQAEHGLEVWAADGQHRPVGPDPPAIRHQNHVTEPALLPLLVQTLQNLHGLVRRAEHLQRTAHGSEVLVGPTRPITSMTHLGGLAGPAGPTQTARFVHELLPSDRTDLEDIMETVRFSRTSHKDRRTMEELLLHKWIPAEPEPAGGQRWSHDTSWFWSTGTIYQNILVLVPTHTGTRTCFNHHGYSSKLVPPEPHREYRFWYRGQVFLPAACLPPGVPRCLRSSTRLATC